MAESIQRGLEEERTKRVQAEDRARELEEATGMLERTREEVQEKREEAEGRAKKAEEALEVERARAQIAAEFAEGQVETITKRCERAEESLRRVGEIIAGRAPGWSGEAQDEISETLKRAGSYPPPTIVDLGEIPAPIRFEPAGYFRGHPTAEGYSFERIRNAEDLAQEDELRVKLEAAGRKNVELEDYADSMRAQIRELTDALLGGDMPPPWWVTAAGALAELQRLEELKPPYAKGGVVAGEVTITLGPTTFESRPIQTEAERREAEQRADAAEERERRSQRRRQGD